MHNKKAKNKQDFAWSYLHNIRQEWERMRTFYSHNYVVFALRMGTGNNYNGKISDDRWNWFRQRLLC